MNNPPKPSALSEQEQLLAKARSTAYGLAARLILSPSDPVVHEQMAEYLDGEGAEAMAAMRELEQLFPEQVEQRLLELSQSRPDSSAAPALHAQAGTPASVAQGSDWPDEADDLDDEDLAYELDADPAESDIEPEQEDWQAAEPEQDPADEVDEVDPDDDDDAWLREWDREALAAGEPR